MTSIAPWSRLLRFAGRYLERVELRPLATNFIQAYGYLDSVRSRRAVAADGQPIPWFTYPAIEYLETLRLQEVAVFEWGSGSSSSYFAARCASIESVESDAEWYGMQQQRLRSNQRIIHAASDDDAYVTAIDRGGHESYGLIIIDGIQRSRCAAAAVRRLQPGGILVLDNADRYPTLCTRLCQHGLLQVDFHGHGPINPYTWTTTLFIDVAGGASQPLLATQRRPGPVRSRAGLAELAPDDGSW